MDRIITTEPTKEKSSETLSEQSHERRADNSHKPIVQDMATMESFHKMDVDTDYPPPTSIETSSTLDINETKNFIHRISLSRHPRITYPESLDESPAHSCPDDSTNDGDSSEQATTIIMTLSDSSDLMDRLKNLCTRSWKNDPIVAVVTFSSEASKLHLDHEIRSRCSLMQVLVYKENTFDGRDSDYIDEEGNYNYYIKTEGEEDDETPDPVSSENNNFGYQSPTLSVNESSESQDPEKEHKALNEESSQGKNQFDSRISGETRSRDNAYGTSSPRSGPRTLLQVPKKAPPLPYLYNSALARVQTSHVLILDESVWPTEDLDTIIRSAYRTSIPRLDALLLPKVLTSNTALSLEDLPDCLLKQSCRLKGPESEHRDGTTKLLPCIESTTYFEPYVVMPCCTRLAPNGVSSESQRRHLRYRKQLDTQGRPRRRQEQARTTQQLAWQDERLTPRTWRLAQMDQLRYAGLHFWLSAGFVYGPEQENLYDQADDVVWRYFHESVVYRFGDDNDDSPQPTIVPACEDEGL